MEIGYVYGFNSSPPVGGGGVHAFNLATNLSRMGHTVHVFEPEAGNSFVIYSTTEQGITQFLKRIDILYIRIDGSLLSDSELKLQCILKAKVPIVWEVNSPVDEALARMRYTASTYSGHKSKFVEVAKVFVRDILIRAKIRAETRLRRKLAKNVEVAICVSDSLKAHANQQLGIDKCVVIPNGSNPALFSDKLSGDHFQGYSDRYKVIYAGASQWFWQGVDVIDELASMSALRNDNFLFIVLDYSNSSLRAPKHKNVVTLNGVGYFDVPHYLASADACLCLYHDFSWSSVGFYLSPLKLYDYMSSGKPVVASNLGQISQVIEDGIDGLLVTDDPNDIYSKLLFCRDSENASREIGAAARRKIVDTYNWQSVAESTAEIFESIVDIPSQ